MASVPLGAGIHPETSFTWSGSGSVCDWLTRSIPSPLRDGGYDITDFTSVQPDLGDLRDVGLLLEEAHISTASA